MTHHNRNQTDNGQGEVIALMLADPSDEHIPTIKEKGNPKYHLWHVAIPNIMALYR